MEVSRDRPSVYCDWALISVGAVVDVAGSFRPRGVSPFGYEQLRCQIFGEFGIPVSVCVAGVARLTGVETGRCWARVWGLRAQMRLGD